jgi:hypothetical protein
MRALAPRASRAPRLGRPCPGPTAHVRVDTCATRRWQSPATLAPTRPTRGAARPLPGRHREPPRHRGRAPAGGRAPRAGRPASVPWIDSLSLVPSHGGRRPAGPWQGGRRRALGTARPSLCRWAAGTTGFAGSLRGADQRPATTGNPAAGRWVQPRPRHPGNPAAGPRRCPARPGHHCARLSGGGCFWRPAAQAAQRLRDPCRAEGHWQREGGNGSSESGPGCRRAGSPQQA